MVHQVFRGFGRHLTDQHLEHQAVDVVAELRDVFGQVEPVFAVEGGTTAVVIARKVTDTATDSAGTPFRPAG